VSTLGKIFAFIVLVCSVAFAMTAWVMKETSENWKGKHDKLQTKYNEETTKLKAACKKAESERDDAVTKREAAEAETKRFKGLNDAQALEIKDQGDRYIALKKEKDQLEINLNAIKTEIRVQTQRNDKLTAENKQLLQDKEDAVKAQKTAEDNLAKAEDDNTRLRNMLKLTSGQLSAAEEKIKAYVLVFGNDGVRQVRAIIKQVPPDMVNGRVQNADNHSGIVEVSVGKDDGLTQGQTLEVFRPDAGVFVGRLNVEKVYDERAICRINRQMTPNPIRSGDHVATRIK